MRWFISGQRRSSSATRNADPEPLLIKISPLTNASENDDKVKDKEAISPEKQQLQHNSLHNGHVPEGHFSH
eukprot:07260.XXX_121899_116433_1 [CDS] Oithona nana genome sequencing.